MIVERCAASSPGIALSSKTTGGRPPREPLGRIAAIASAVDDTAVTFAPCAVSSSETIERQSALSSTTIIRRTPNAACGADAGGRATRDDVARLQRQSE